MARCGGRWSGFGPTAMPRVAIVAALEREVRPLVKRWRVSEKEHDGRLFRFFEKDDVVVICGGIGSPAARRAAEAVISLFHPYLIYSVGFAGGLDAMLKVGDIVRPSRIVNASDGSSIPMSSGQGVLISFAAVTSREQKSKLRESYGAHAVDMEAAAVASAAEAHGIQVAAIKAISDAADFELPPMECFVNPDGSFSEARFAVYAALRPWTWLQVVRLARNTRRAARALCADLAKIAATGADLQDREPVNL
jgi:adenosylhomocysteine nucleosidase